MGNDHLNTNLEKKFEAFRSNIIGFDYSFTTPFGKKDLVYADWIASGRMYLPIENAMLSRIAPIVANTHSEASFTGRSMNVAYQEAHQIIKKHVNANEDDVILTTGTGMTGALCKFMRMQGLRIPEQFHKQIKIDKADKPVVFITHMEHHSNHTSWLESIAEVVIVPPADDLTISLDNVDACVKEYADRKIKIGSFTACSNVTGIRTPFHAMAKIMHKYGGLCFIDLAASAPYDNINMHPDDLSESLDAIFFSPHKFLGGPGSSGVVIFNKNLYHNQIPDTPGGGTVKWTNPWGKHSYFENIELREDGGTPGFLQAIRTALCIRLKEEMSVEDISNREDELLKITFSELKKVNGLHILADNVEDRLGVISFYIENIHYNLFVSLLNDLYGIQVRGGCSCAGTYGHILLNVDKSTSNIITYKIDHGDLTEKPGWIRMSLHPTMTNEELYFITNSIKELTENIDAYKNDYLFNKSRGEYYHKNLVGIVTPDYLNYH